MLTSAEFWLVTAVVLIFYYLIPRSAQNIFLLICSYLLYAYWDLRALPLLWVATGLTFLIGKRLTKETLHRRWWLYTGIIFNAGVLALFKYANVFVDGIKDFTVKFGFSVNDNTLNILIPLGISFYTFRLLSYLLDIYNNRISPSSSIVNFALYIAFFPQILSGPIERPKSFLEKLSEPRQIKQQNFVDGVFLLLVGLYYKIVIADLLMPVVQNSFADVTKLSSAQAFVSIVLYSIRLYADFAGYSAIAIGISTWFGLPASDNFRQPYFSRNISEFWTRWHMSLSFWFRDYIFYPVSRYLLKRFGNKYTFPIQVCAYGLTMLVTGVWHGPNLTFVAWGGLHAFYMSVEQGLIHINKQRPQPPVEDEIRPVLKRLNLWANVLVTQVLVAIAWVFFASSSISNAFAFFERLLTPNFALDPVLWTQLISSLLMLIFIDLLQIRIHGTYSFWKLQPLWQGVACAIILIALFIFGGKPSAPFVYFQF